MSMDIDASEFNAELTRFAATLRIDEDEALRRVAADVVLKACVMTPPSSGKTVRPHWAASKRIGQSLIVRDNFGENGVFSELPEEMLQDRQQSSFLNYEKGTAEDRFLWRKANGETWTVPKRNVVLGADPKRMEEFRRPLRGKNGKMRGLVLKTPDQDGNVFRIKKMVVSKAAANAWKKYVFAKVGRAKGGWNKAAEKLGIANRFPVWVRRHTGTPGGAEMFKEGTDKGSWFVYNDVQYGTSWKHRARIMDEAMTGALKSMEAQINAVLAKLAGRFNAK